MNNYNCNTINNIICSNLKIIKFVNNINKNTIIIYHFKNYRQVKFKSFHKLIICTA